MPHESGDINAGREARVPVRLAVGESVQCLLDTGFDGALLLPRALGERLQIQVVGRLVLQVAGGSHVGADVGLAQVEWLGESRFVEVIFGGGADTLIGTEMLAGTRLVLDYVAGTVAITA